MQLNIICCSIENKWRQIPISIWIQTLAKECHEIFSCIHEPDEKMFAHCVHSWQALLEHWNGCTHRHIHDKVENMLFCWVDGWNKEQVQQQQYYIWMRKNKKNKTSTLLRSRNRRTNRAHRQVFTHIHTVRNASFTVRSISFCVFDNISPQFHTFHDIRTFFCFCAPLSVLHFTNSILSMLSIRIACSFLSALCKRTQKPECFLKCKCFLFDSNGITGAAVFLLFTVTDFLFEFPRNSLFRARIFAFMSRWLCKQTHLCIFIIIFLFPTLMNRLTNVFSTFSRTQNIVNCSVSLSLYNIVLSMHNMQSHCMMKRINDAIGYGVWMKSF